jgi:hypothetical protein
MAFCNSCGAAVDAGVKFCNKCGAAMPAVAAPAASASPSQPAGATPPVQGGGNAVKIILIVVAVIVGLGILGIGAVSYIGYRFAKSTHVREHKGDVKVETPFGTVESSSDSDAAARDIGIELYPGAETIKNGSSSMNIGSMHTVSVQLQTDDSPSQVNDFYKNKLSNVTYSANQGDQYTMMVGSKDDMTTITIAPEEGKTHIVISKVTKK